VRGELRQEASLTMQPRFSLCTILEIVFVATVVLMLVYQSFQPAAAPMSPSPLVGRYQLENAGTNEPFLVDTVTGEAYSADTSLRPWFWKKVAEPVGQILVVRPRQPGRTRYLKIVLARHQLLSLGAKPSLWGQGQLNSRQKTSANSSRRWKTASVR
jgi:hypothetical protein